MYPVNRIDTMSFQSMKMTKFDDNKDCENCNFDDFDDFDDFSTIENFLLCQDKIFMRKIFYVASNMNKN
ncbi:hypothetical protein QKC54_gp0765 [Megavirus baoshan]|uniref:Uncharacterized protein n=1 Tax=Megavirus baoshan TaxID=2496520 RepID=A0A8K1T0W0_9VIRU|nr:hypothetical protein QKC54_gp0765 [Megavirus baoshan]UFX99788.1 hypothetical protein Mb0307 [Megavirus baoshan]